MSLATLPLIVVENIISYSALQPEFPSRDWKRNLTLLSICREWRKAALPLVYSYLYFSSGNELGSGFNSENDGIFSATSSGYTNIGLIKSLGYTKLVKKLAIQLGFTHYLESFVNSHEVLFGFSSYNWTKVSTIEISIDHPIENANVDNEFRFKVELFANKLKSAMPYINDIGFSTTDGYSKGFLLCKSIFAMYSAQLRGLHCGDMPIITDIGIPVNLTTTGLHTSLESATLNNTNYYNNSSTLSNRSDNVIGFNQLRKLSLFLHADEQHAEISNDQTEHPGYMLNSKMFVFPELEILELSLQSTDQIISYLCSDSYVFSNVKTLILYFRQKEDALELNNISEYTANSIVENIRTRMPNIQNLQMHCIMLDDVDIDLVNSLASSYRHCMTEFVILHSFSIIPFACGKLIRLTIDATLECLLDFVKLNASTLEILTLNNVPYGFTWASITNSDINSSIIFPCLKTLRIIFNFRCQLESDLKLLVERHQQVQPNNANIISDVNIIFPRLESVSVLRSSYYVLQNMILGIGMLPNALSLKIDYSTILNGISNCAIFNSSNFKVALKNLGDNILFVMPNIRKLEYNTNVRTKYNDICFNTLNNGYCLQLDTVSSDTYLATNYLAYSNLLENATLHTSNVNAHFQLSLHSHSLRNFAIIDNSGNFSWTWFKPLDHQGIIKLDNLTKLFVRMCENSRTNIHFLLNPHNVENEPPLRIYMPNLECVDIEVFNRYTSLSPTEIYFNTASAVNLIGPVCALPIQGKMNSNILNGLEVTITSANAQDKEQFYCLTNSWFGGRMPIGPSELKLEILNFDIEPKRMLWINVKRLTINCSLRITTLFSILPGMSNLRNLIVSHILVDGLPGCIKQFEYSDQDQPKIEYLSATVETISISNLDMCGNHDAGISSITHLALANPSLKLFKVKGLKMEKAALVKQYRTKYPHVNNIVFK